MVESGSAGEELGADEGGEEELGAEDGVSGLGLAGSDCGHSAMLASRNEIATAKEGVMPAKILSQALPWNRKNFIRKLIRGIPVKRNSYNEFVRWLQSYESENLEWKVKTFQ